MNAEIITIGDEILIGQIVDTNAAFVGKELTNIGLEVEKITSIKDGLAEIMDILKSSSAEVILITGGLGPTRDDMTKKALCDFFDDKLEMNFQALKRVEEIFADQDRELLQKNRDQALLPSKAKVLINKYGTASGMWFEEKGRLFISLPGVPVEMKHLMIEEVLPRLKTKFEPYYIEQQTLLTYGIGESLLAEKIKDIEDDLPEYMDLAYLPGPGRVRLRLMARGKDKKFLGQEIQKWTEKLKHRVENNYGGVEGEGSLAEDIAKFFSNHKLTLSTAESFTGGKIANIFTEMPGASIYFKGGILPYHTQIKIDVLGVSEEIVKTHSVVSAEVAEAMALRAQKIFKSDFAIGTTGNAGPTKGDSDAEIGTAFIALATPDRVIVRKFKLGNVRSKVVGKAVIKALEILKQELFVERK